MNIGGFLKQTLSDFPGKIAAIIFTQGCNLRCPYCHNPDLLAQNITGKFEWDDIWTFLKSRQNQLDGVVISGGEPLLQPDISEAIMSIRSLGFAIKLDTNGTFPKKLNELIKNRLVDYVAMDIKSSSDLFHRTVRKNIKFDTIVESIEILRQSNIPYEFRSTLIDGIHDLDEMDAMARTISGAEKYYLQKLSGFNTLDSELQSMKSYSSQIMEQFQMVAGHYVSQCHIR